jgi:hypothetical protein
MQATESFYTEAGVLTSPRQHAAALAGLPEGVAALTKVAQGLIVHEHMTGMYGFELPAERRPRPCTTLCWTAWRTSPSPHSQSSSGAADPRGRSALHGRKSVGSAAGPGGSMRRTVVGLACRPDSCACAALATVATT